MEETTQILVCNCNSAEHQIVIFRDDEVNLFHCAIHLNSSLNFIQRLILGVKYIFGYHCKYGNWDEFTFDRSHAKVLRELSNELIRN